MFTKLYLINCCIVNLIKKSNKKQISFTKLVIAVGGSSPFPGKIISRNEKCSKEDGCKMYSDFFKQVVKISKKTGI